VAAAEACRRDRDVAIERAIGQLEAQQATREAELRATHAAAEATLRRRHDTLLQVRPPASSPRVTRGSNNHTHTHSRA